MFEDDEEGALMGGDLLKDVKAPYVTFSFTIPSKTYFAESIKADIYARSLTTFQVLVTSDNVKITFNPEMFVDVTFPVDNVLLKEIVWDFKSAMISSIDAPYEDKLSGMNFSAQTEVVSIIKDMLEKKLVKTNLGQKNYDPIKDNEIFTTIQNVLIELQKEDPDDTNSDFTISKPDFKTLENVKFRVGFEAKNDINIGDQTARAQVKAGDKIQVIVSFAGNLDAFYNNLPKSTIVSEIQIQSEKGLVLNYDGQDILNLTKASIASGGKFSLDEYQTLLEEVNAYKALKTIEAGGILAAILFRARNLTGISRYYALKAPATDPKITEKFTKSFIELSITNALKEKLKENCTPFSNEYNLCISLGIKN